MSIEELIRKLACLIIAISAGLIAFLTSFYLLGFITNSQIVVKEVDKFLERVLVK